MKAGQPATAAAAAAWHAEARAGGRSAGRSSSEPGGGVSAARGAATTGRPAATPAATAARERDRSARGRCIAIARAAVVRQNRLRLSESRKSPATSPSAANADKRPARRSVVPKRRVTLAERRRARQRASASCPSSRRIWASGSSKKTSNSTFSSRPSSITRWARWPRADVTAVARTRRRRSDTPAAQIAAMLANPDGVRQAVIINEILRRPSDRW